MGASIVVTLGQQYIVGEKPTVILCTLTLMATQGHQKNSKNKNNAVSYFKYCFPKQITAPLWTPAGGAAPLFPKPRSSDT